MRYFLLGWFVLKFAFSFAQQDSAAFQLILVGDAGSSDTTPLQNLISQYANHSAGPSAVIFLGDNLYPKGLPPPRSKDRKAGEQILLDQISMASGLGEIYFVPGNHDWKNGHHDGLRYRMHQQMFLDSLKNSTVHFLPRDGCPGPEEIHLSKELVLVIIDTQWFLHPWDKPEGETSHCDAKSATDVTIHLDDILNRNQGKRVIVAGHHPVFSYGQHGGVFSFKDHLFPLTQVDKNYYLPLPILGSILPLYRNIFGNIQDIAHPVNKALRRSLQETMQQYPGTVYVSGHEHTLQYIEHDSVQYIVSGSGSKSTPVKKKGFSRFASSEIGFARIMVKKDGNAEVEYYSTAGKIFSSPLLKIKAIEQP